MTTITPRCRFYNTARGCKRGNKCHFTHLFVECKYSSVESCPKYSECLDAHWRPCQNHCGARTLRGVYCKFCWRYRKDEATTRSQRPCQTPDCKNLTPYVLCGQCFHLRPWQRS